MANDHKLREGDIAPAIQVTQDSLRTMDAAADPERRRQLQHALTQYQQRLKKSAEKKDKS